MSGMWKSTNEMSNAPRRSASQVSAPFAVSTTDAGGDRRDERRHDPARHGGIVGDQDAQILGLRRRLGRRREILRPCLASPHHRTPLRRAAAAATGIS
jgi:hypothetical protein